MREIGAKKAQFSVGQKNLEATMYQSRFSLEHQWDTQRQCAGKAVISLAVYPLRL
jgi:hypothetical protein